MGSTWTDIAENGADIWSRGHLDGYTATERVEELAGHLAKNEGIEPAEVRRRCEAEIPIGRLAEPREFAAVAAFLVSERVSDVTGSSIAVDGGWIQSLF